LCLVADKQNQITTTYIQNGTKSKDKYPTSAKSKNLEVRIELKAKCDEAEVATTVCLCEEASESHGSKTVKTCVWFSIETP